MSQQVIHLRKFTLHERGKLSLFRPEDLKEYFVWEDAWRCRLMDLAVRMSNRNQDAFQVAAVVILAGYLAGYDR